MGKYVYSLIVISIIGGILNNLFSSLNGVKRLVNFFIGLVMVLCLILPIVELVNDYESIKNKFVEYIEDITSSEKIEESNEIIIKNGIEAIQKGIKRDLINKFNFDEKDVVIEIEVDKSNIEAIKIKKINIVLTGKASWSDTARVKKYLSDLIGGDISVVRR